MFGAAPTVPTTQRAVAQAGTGAYAMWPALAGRGRLLLRAAPGACAFAIRSPRRAGVLERDRSHGAVAVSLMGSRMVLSPKLATRSSLRPRASR